MKWLAVAVAALVLVGCAKNIDNQEAAQKAVDEYFAKPELRTMTARVQNVIFRGTEADATVMVTGKGADPSTAIPIPYILERKSNGWAVKGPSKTGMAGHAAQNNGQMPQGHPGGATGEGQPLPPGHPATGNAPGSQKDGSQKLNMPADHPPIGGSGK